MGFLDSIRDRLTGGYDDDYDDDDYYDDGDYEDDEDDFEEEQPRGTGILGNTPRPEAESVAVYTRSGRPVSTNAGSVSTPSRAASSSSRTSSYSSRRRSRDDYENEGYDDFESSGSYRSTPAPSFNSSGQLPPYVLRAQEYEDVQTVVRRVRTNQPVFLVLNDTPGDIAQRILDFCFGLAFGIGGEVQPVGGACFLIVPEGIQVSQSEIDRLANEAR